jgi:hypothetical protein
MCTIGFGAATAGAVLSTLSAVKMHTQLKEIDDFRKNHNIDVLNALLTDFEKDPTNAIIIAPTTIQLVAMPVQVIANILGKLTYIKDAIEVGQSLVGINYAAQLSKLMGQNVDVVTGTILKSARYIRAETLDNVLSRSAMSIVGLFEPGGIVPSAAELSAINFKFGLLSTISENSDDLAKAADLLGFLPTIDGAGRLKSLDFSFGVTVRTLFDDSTSGVRELFAEISANPISEMEELTRFLHFCETGEVGNSYTARLFTILAEHNPEGKGAQTLTAIRTLGGRCMRAAMRAQASALENATKLEAIANKLLSTVIETVDPITNETIKTVEISEELIDEIAREF